MASGSIARRYAKALLEIGVADGKFELYGNQIAQLVTLLGSSRDLHGALTNPIFPMSQREQVLVSIATRLGLSPIVRNFLRLLLSRERLGALGDIARALRALVDAQAGRVRAEVRSARPLPDETVREIQSALTRRHGKQVILDVKVDPSLIGGVQAKVGDVVYDGSIRAQLEELKRQMTSN